MPTVKKIISGGQTGADRAALDFAIAHCILHGGKCPKGRLAEDGVLDAKYQLIETPESEYIHRTRANVVESDGTVIFTIGTLEGGSRLTADYAHEYGKPYLHLDLNVHSPALAAAHLKKWLKRHHIKILNIAGSRASRAPELYERVIKTLEMAFGNAGR